MGDIATFLAAGRQRVVDLVADLDDGEAKTPVPTCPEWTVADVVAHLTGVCTDILAGNIAGAATPPWTAAQVEARRGRPIADIVAEWTEAAPQVEAIVEHFPGRTPGQMLFDVTAHEHDIRAALRRPGARDSEGVHQALGFLAQAYGASVTAARLAPVELRTDDGPSWVVGGGDPLPGGPAEAANAVLFGGADFTGGEPAIAVQASAFDVFRMLSGRRSAAQVRAFAWTGDPEPYVQALTFGPFSPIAVDVDE